MEREEEGGVSESTATVYLKISFLMPHCFLCSRFLCFLMCHASLSFFLALHPPRAEIFISTRLDLDLLYLSSLLSYSIPFASLPLDKDDFNLLARWNFKHLKKLLIFLKIWINFSTRFYAYNCDDYWLWEFSIILSINFWGFLDSLNDKRIL